MVKVIFYKNSKKEYRGFDFSGHADYDEEGRDIVCASISVLVINMINSVEAFTGDSFDVKTDEENGKIHFFLTGKVSPETKLLMRSLIQGLVYIKRQYGKKYVQLLIKEV